MRDLKILLKKEFIIGFKNIIPIIWKDKKKRKTLLIYPLLLLIIGGYLAGFIGYIFKFLDIYMANGKVNQFMFNGFAISLMLTLVFALPSLISTIYMTNDVKILLALPIKSNTILFTKILYTNFFLSTYGLFIWLPMLIKYGIVANPPFYYYIGMFLAFISIQLITVVIITAIVVFLMKYVNRMPKAKNIMQFLSMFLIIVMSIGISIAGQVIGQGKISRQSQAMFLTNMKNKYFYLFPQLKLIDKMIRFDGSLNYIYVIVLLVIAVVLTYVVSKLFANIMVKGVLTNNIISKRKRISSGDANKILKRNSVVNTISKNDFKNILSNPTYVFNTIGYGLLFPIFFIIPTALNFNDIKRLLPNIRDTLNTLDPLLLLSIAILASITIFIFLGLGVTFTSGTGISREGKYFWIIRSLPIDSDKFIDGKIKNAIISGVISLSLTIVIVLFVTNINIYILLGLFIGLISDLILCANFGIFMDVNNPKFDWNTPQEVMKQSSNGFIFSFGSMMMSGILGYISYRILDLYFTGEIVLSVLFAISLALATLLIIIGIGLNLIAKKKLAKNITRF